jgi:hypothetical protein
MQKECNQGAKTPAQGRCHINSDPLKFIMELTCLFHLSAFVKLE